MEKLVSRVRRVVIVDDSRVSRAVLEAAFEARTDYEVVGVASDAESGRDLLSRLRPDVVTIDLSMPYIDGARMLETISDMPDLCKVIVSDQAVASVSITSKLETLGASLCFGKKPIFEDPSSFFAKVGLACRRIEAAAARKRDIATFNLPDSLRAQAGKPSSIPFHAGYPIPLDEHDRLSLVRRKRLTDAVRERQFDHITSYTAGVTEFPVCLLTFMASDTQWIKSSFGFAAESTSRTNAFCSHTIANDSVFVVTNAATDPRFSANPLVTGDPGFRAYVGQPVLSADGVTLGAICVLDTKVRVPSASAKRHLEAMAQIVGGIIDERPALAA